MVDYLVENERIIVNAKDLVSFVVEVASTFLKFQLIINFNWETQFFFWLVYS